MEELVKYIVENLVSDKTSFDVKSETDEKGAITILVSVAKTEMGRVIGKNGKIAQSIRAIVKTASSKLDNRYFVKFVERVWKLWRHSFFVFNLIVQKIVWKLSVIW